MSTLSRSFGFSEYSSNISGVITRYSATRGNIPSRFSRNSEASASEFLENIEELFLEHSCIDIFTGFKSPMNRKCGTCCGKLSRSNGVFRKNMSTESFPIDISHENTCELPLNFNYLNAI